MYRSVALSVLLCLLFSGLFVADLLGYFNRTSDPIATLESSDGTVRRLGLNQLTWDRAMMGTLFGAGDTIATGESSKAKLVFHTGGEVLLDEGAMLVLGGSIEELQLNFISGSGRVRVAKESATRITVAQGAPVARSGRAPSALARPSVARVKVEQVEKVAQLQTKPVETAQAEQPKAEFTPAIKEEAIRETAEVLSTGGEIASVAKLPPTPEIVFPSKDAVFDLTTGTVPKLEWKVADIDGPPKDVTYEIILRPAQESGAGEESGEAKVLRTRNPALSLSRVSHGKYLWSVRTVASDGTRSPASQARFMEVIVPARIERPRVLPVRID